MTAKPKSDPKLTDAERHKRFFEMARGRGGRVGKGF